MEVKNKGYVKRVWNEPGCITCGMCQYLAPEVFEVTDISRVKKEVDVAAHSDAIKNAARECPVQIIKYEESE
jgi:ferredoxin